MHPEYAPGGVENDGIAIGITPVASGIPEPDVDRLDAIARDQKPGSGSNIVFERLPGRAIVTELHLGLGAYTASRISGRKVKGNQDRGGIIGAVIDGDSPYRRNNTT
ncbi:hypothetical protein ES703_72911 [subsurface metagenome]